VDELSEREIMNVIGKKSEPTLEDQELAKEVNDREPCPYGICNGSGLIRKEGSTTAEQCKCLVEQIMEQKLKNSNINLKYLGKGFDYYDNKTKFQLFIPKEKPGPIDGRLKDPKNEKVEKFIERHYDIKEDERSLKKVLFSYAETNNELLDEKEDGVNLLLFGDPANGKTSFAIAIGLYFLEKNKSVYFTTTQNLIDKVFDNKEEVARISREVDVLILDELFNEYHSSNGLYAQKRLMEILKVREELGLITVCTSNGNPRDFNLLYGESFMSLINGTFFMFRLERETDARVEQMLKNYDKFNF